MASRIRVADGEMVARQVVWARGPFARARGLLATPRIEPGVALAMDRGKQIHTFGMKYPIDVVFCDRDWCVLHVVRAMPPRRISGWVGRSRYVIEMMAGSVSEDVRPGVKLVLAQ